MNEINKRDKFLKFYSNKGTKNCYSSYLKKFEKTLNCNLNYWIKRSKEQIMDDIKTALIQYEKIPPKSKQTMMNAVKSFLEDNYIETPIKFWKTIRLLTKGGPLTDDIVPTTEQLRAILYKGDVKDKALFLVLATSGMYHGEALKIEERDIHFEHTPTMITIREEIAHKGGKRVTFITKETEYWLKKWLKQKQDYLIHANKINNLKTGKINLNDNRVFCFSKSVSRDMWNRLIKDDSELNIKDENTKRHKYHIHTLRKYFRTTLGPHMKIDIIETLMGHENSLQRAYRKYNLETLSKEYSEHEKELSIIQPKMNEEELLDRLNEIEKSKQDLLEKQKFYNERLRAQELSIENYENRFKKIEENLHIALNPKTEETQNILNYFKPVMINFVESLTGKKITKEQLEKIDTGTNFVLNELNTLPADKAIELIKPENLPFIYEQLKNKKIKLNES